MKHKIYMGWDSRETLAYDIARKSFIAEAKEPKNLQIIPLQLSSLQHLLSRPVEWRGTQMWCPISEAPQTTEFSISRFLVPHLNNYKGWTVFIDCDVVCYKDIAELFALKDDKYAVMVVKHEYEPKQDIHMVDQIQVKMPAKKNWASMILWNCAHPSNKLLTLEKINTWPGRDLHQFKWLNDSEIGEVPQSWNFLIGENEGDDVNIAHFTLGGPWLPNWQPSIYDGKWNEAYEKYKK